jgi:hypothetical protein
MTSTTLIPVLLIATIDFKTEMYFTNRIITLSWEVKAS